MIRILIVLAIVSVGGFFAARQFGWLGKSEVVQANIPVYKVQMRDFEVRLPSLGTLDASSKRQISAPYSGKVVKLLPEGELVDEGDPVIWLETTVFEDTLENNETELDIAQKDLQKSQEDYTLLLSQQQLDFTSLQAKLDFQKRKEADSQKQYENTKSLVEGNLAPVSDLESQKLSLLQSQLDVDEAKIALEKFNRTRENDAKRALAEIEKKKVNVERFQREVDDGRRDIDNAVLRAPGRGHISYIVMRDGPNRTKISEGSQVFQRNPLIEIPDSSMMLAKAPINEVDISKVKEGQRVEVRVMAFPDRIFPGKVLRKSVVPLASNMMMGRGMTTQDESSVKEFEVAVEVQGDESAALRQGMTASVDIIVEEAQKRLAIPQEAIFRENGRDVVFKSVESNYQTIEVKLGRDNLNFVEALEGVSEGDLLFLRNPERQLEKLGLLGDAAG